VSFRMMHRSNRAVCGRKVLFGDREYRGISHAMGMGNFA
jgi:hypothetical protein